MNAQTTPYPHLKAQNKTTWNSFYEKLTVIICVTGILRCIVKGDADVEDIKNALQLSANLLEKATQELDDLHVRSAGESA